MTGRTRPAWGCFANRASRGRATTVGEPGGTGSLRRLHDSVRLPSPTCDFFRLTATKGRGAGESLLHFPIRAGDHVLADRGYSTAKDIGHVAAAGGHVIVRVNTRSPVLRTTGGAPWALHAIGLMLSSIGSCATWTTGTNGRYRNRIHPGAGVGDATDLPPSGFHM